MKLQREVYEAEAKKQAAKAAKEEAKEAEDKKKGEHFGEVIK